MHLSYISQCTILQQKYVHVCTFLLQSSALCNIFLMHCGIYEMGLLLQGKGSVNRCFVTAGTWRNGSVPSRVRDTTDIAYNDNTSVSLNVNTANFSAYFAYRRGLPITHKRG